MKKRKSVFVSLIVVMGILAGVFVFRIDPELSVSDKDGLRIARIEAMRYQNYMGPCSKEYFEHVIHKFSSVSCSADAGAMDEVLAARATAWASSGDVYPLGRMQKVAIDASIYQSTTQDWVEFIKYAFADMTSFWKTEMEKAGLNYQQPTLIIGDANYMSVVVEKAGLSGRLDQVIYDRKSRQLVVPHPSLWGSNLPKPEVATTIEIVTQMMWPLARSIHQSADMESANSDNALMAHASYLTGVYTYSRFPHVDVKHLRAIGDAVWLNEGYQSGDPGRPGPLHGNYPWLR